MEGLVGGGSKTGPPTDDYRVGQRPLFCPRDGIQSSPVAEFYPVPSSSLGESAVHSPRGFFTFSQRNEEIMFHAQKYMNHLLFEIIWNSLKKKIYRVFF